MNLVNKRMTAVIEFEYDELVTLTYIMRLISGDAERTRRKHCEKLYAIMGELGVHNYDPAKSNNIAVGSISFKEEL